MTNRAVSTAARAYPPSPSTQAARARAEIMSPFHPVSTLSSLAGRGRRLRRASKSLRSSPRPASSSEASTPHSRAHSSTGRPRYSTLAPVRSPVASSRKFPSAVTPYTRQNRSPRSLPSTSMISARVHT